MREPYRDVDRRSLVPRASGLKAVRPSFAFREACGALKDGTTAAALRSERGVPHSGFASGSFRNPDPPGR